MAPITRPRGTRDFGPRQMRLRRRLETRMRQSLSRHGYQEVQTPAFEHLELFAAKSGEAIKDELYAFKDKAGRDLALRPEITAAVMRFYHESLSVEPHPLKLWYLSNCFRYDRPQKGRYREFWQVGCEIIGSDTPEANAELIALCLALLRDSGVRELDVRIGHIALLRGLLAAIGAPPGATGEGGPLMRAIDKWDETAIGEILAAAGVPGDKAQAFMDLGAAGGDPARDREQVQAVLDKGEGGTVERAREAITELDAVFACLDALGAPSCRLDPMIARGLDYYTGLVFEVDAPRLGAEKQVAGGGGYDLSSVFAAKRVPTTGFALGFDRLLVALEEEEKEGAERQEGPWIDVYLAPIGDAQRSLALQTVTRLRAAGWRVETDLMRRPPGKNLKAADAHQARWAILIGERERQAGTASVKELETGAQEQVPLDSLARWLDARGPPRS